MSRQLASSEKLAKMINDRLKEGKELDGDCRDVTVSGVQRWYAEPDESRCNWDVYSYSGPPACSDVFSLVIEEFRKEFNLQDD